MKVLTLQEVRSRSGNYLDFFVSGKSLMLEIERRGHGGGVPRLGGSFLAGVGSGLVPIDVETRSLLLCEHEGDTPSGRVGLYVCSECGDYGCGVVSVRITRVDDDFLWSEFCQEDSFLDTCEPIERLGPFRFRGEDYRRTIANGIVTQT